MCAGRLFCLLVCLLLFCLLAGISDSYAAATLLLEEPYSYDGAFAGTGHSAVYLSNVCADSPVVLRTCTAGETGVVLSRYDGIQGYDWVAIPLISYLYAVDRAAAVPLFADVKLVAFLRDRYRREHLEALAPDRADGGTPEGNWYELVGASYDRTIYGFEIETSAQQDALLIANFNRGPNRERYNFVKRNCADFVREVINFYYPHALHRSVIGDLGVTTPKQIAKMLVRYSQHHPELESSDFLVPQVPGSVGRSKPVHGVLESVMAAKKYMLPLVVLHPYIGGGLLVEYFGHRRFDPGRNALVLNSQFELDSPLTKDERATYQSRVNELGQVSTGRLRDDEPARDRNRHDETIYAFALTFEGSLDWTLFGLWLTMLLNRHGEKLLRVKGILNVAGSAAPVAVHGVQHLVHPPVHMAAWPDADRRSRLVFIVDGLDRGLIERSLQAFLRQDAGNGERVLNQTASA